MSVAGGTVIFEPVADGAYVDSVALILAVAAGLVLPRWRQGVAVSAIIVVMAHAFILGLPTIVSGKPFPWTAFDYGIFWAAIALFYARILLAFALAFGVRNLIEFSWRAVRRRF